MRIGLAPRDVRALVLGVVTLAAAIGGFRGLPAWATWRSDVIAEATEMSLQLDRMHTAVDGVEAALESAEAHVTRFREIGSALLLVRDSAQASAALADVIREAARLSAVRIDALQSRTDTSSGRWLQPVSAAVQGEADIMGLAKLLHVLEAHQALLSVRELSVQPLDVHTPQDAVEALRIRMTVEALALVVSQEKP